VWSSFLVIAGVMLAMRRRMRDRDAAAMKLFGENIMPLVLLFAISITGLMLVVSYEWMHGYAYELLAIVHVGVVIVPLAEKCSTFGLSHSFSATRFLRSMLAKRPRPIGSIWALWLFLRSPALYL
jgi:hypothetical protein